MFITTLRRRILLIGLVALTAGAALWQNVRRTTSPDRAGQAVNLGLDLQGGIHLGLELDESVRPSTDPARDLDLALTVLRRRIDEFGVTERVVQKVGDRRIVVELPGFRDPDRARKVVQRTAYLEFRFTDETGRLDRAMPALDRAAPRIADPAIGITTAARLLTGPSAADTAPGVTLSSLLIPTAGGIPGEYAVPATAFATVDSVLRLPAVQAVLPRSIELFWSATETDGARLLYALESRPVLTGTSLAHATAQPDPLSGAPQVNFSLDRTGGETFGKETGRRIGSHLAIMLDGRIQGRPPVIQSRIERYGRIEMGGRSLAEAQDLALVLRAGALPTPLRIVEQHEVGPSLGEDSIQGGILAGVAGTAAVVAIMAGYYAGAGLVAVIALGCYVLLTLGALALLGSALSLPGLAGLVLSIGMAVDANVLIFERIREEQDRGRSSRAATAEGFRQAMPAIVDSNLTTVLTALFLFQFGTGPVQGFAVTLIVGIAASMFTAVFVTRTLFLAWLARRPADRPLPLGATRLFRGSRFPFLRFRRWAYGATAVVLLAGTLVGALRGVRSGVDFSGGSLFQVETELPVDPGRIRTALAANGVAGAEVQRFGGETTFAIRAPAAEDLPAQRATIVAAVTEASGGRPASASSGEGVGPKVASELQTRAALAVSLSFGAVLAYLAVRFEWRFGLAAVAATAHDVLATLAFVIALRIEFTLVVVAALLTVVGYSLNDTIVIFDRARENLAARRTEPLETVLDRSVNETLPRTLLTGGTALATLAALAIFGGPVIRPFALVMFFGIFVGTFSSVFVASPVLLAIHRRWGRS
ncbi:MAG: protein translocase subunit SecD [Gemmatimonadales bacterium]